MTQWIRFNYNNENSFGILKDGVIHQHEGDMFSDNQDTGKTFDLNEVEIDTPCNPTVMLGLWNNFHATAEKNSLPIPEHPWYFVKTPNTYAPAGTEIVRPATCHGKILFEGELGLVIGKTCQSVSVEDAKEYVFGLTCINDVTALEHLFGEKGFDHWTRGKCFDNFGIFGPVITTGIDPNNLAIKTFLKGDGQEQERQNYPVSDMIFKPYEIVSHISHDITLNPGDIIACGTSLGAGAMKPGWTVEIVIDGVATLTSTYSEG